MRARALALVTATAVAATPLTVAVTGATAATTKPHTGQACTKGKKAPAGFSCKKNSKGKYVLVKNSGKSKTKTNTTTTP
ncbi:MAG: hypothetical protein JWQ20_3231 [Conexibacter sp.]|jgi:hypothetical protein|nr:hypothetical protein [Conexibacter sp.]